MIKDLDPEIHRNMHVIAKEEVEVEHLREQLGDGREEPGQEPQSDIERLTADLQRGDSNVRLCRQELHRGSRSRPT